MEEVYMIELTVPLGVRKGQMRYRNEKGHIEGTLKVLGNTTQFCGIAAGNNLIIDGTLKTSVREIYYHGIGSVQNGELQMRLQSKAEIYELTGHLQENENIERDEIE